MRGGDTFTLYDANIDDHLWVVISAPETNPADPVIVVNFTSYSDEKDCTCIVERGEHSRITHRSIVNYEDALDGDRTTLEYQLGVNILQKHEPVSADLLARRLDANRYSLPRALSSSRRLPGVARPVQILICPQDAPTTPSRGILCARGHLFPPRNTIRAF